MIEILGGVSTSHVPLLGVAMDHGKTSEDYFQRVFDGYRKVREWIREKAPDVLILVYNDHANALSLELIPTFAIGCAAEFAIADEGWGRRPVPPAKGDTKLAWHITESLILDEFDITIANNLTLDHGATVPLSLLFGESAEWPCKVIPVVVNVIQYPPPTGKRCCELGTAIARALETYPDAGTAVVVGTGGMSHQLQGSRSGLINADFDRHFLDGMGRGRDYLTDISHIRYLREAGSEGIELVMWLVMRGALPETVREVARLYHVPVSATAVGHLILEPDDDRHAIAN